MNVVVLAPVRKFLKSLDRPSRTEAYALMVALHKYGHHIEMPAAKPIGKGLWELRILNRPAIRILFAFHNDEAVLLHGLKKQRPALLPEEIRLALKRFKDYCG